MSATSSASDARQPPVATDNWSEDRFLDRLMGVGGFGATVVTIVGASCWQGFFWGAVLGGYVSCVEVGAFFILEPIARGCLAERKVRRILASLNIPAVHDVFIRAPDGRQAQLDHVAFLGQGVAVIETKSITGVVQRAGTRWSYFINGRKRWIPGRSPQQQVLDARDVLRDAFPTWRPTSVALTVLTHGELGSGLEGDAWVVTAAQLPEALARFRRSPSTFSQRAWVDLDRYLTNCRRTRCERWRFFRHTQLRPSNFARQQLIGFGVLMSVAMLTWVSLVGLLVQDVVVPALRFLVVHFLTSSGVAH